MPEFRVIVAGSRTFDNAELMFRELDELLSDKLKTHTVIIVSGTARGADQLGEKYAFKRGLTVERFPAQWDLYGKSAGRRRNYQMADVAQALAAFWDGSSRGTKHMIDTMNGAGKLVEVIRF